MSIQIEGPWDFMGILIEIARNCKTKRPCLTDFKRRSYFSYHNGGLENGSFRRPVCIDRLYYNNNGTMKRIMMTPGGGSLS